jgi:hypothetical protein
MRKKCEPHFHHVPLPSGRIIRTEKGCHVNPNFEYDEELGFLPALAALAPAAISLGSEIFGGKKKGGGGAAAAPTVIDSGGGVDTAALLSAIQSAERGANTAEVRSIVRELLSEVPPPVRQQVTDALKEYKLQNVDIKETMGKIVNDIGKQMSPALTEAIQMLADSQVQRQATNEHRILEKEDKRWNSNVENQKKILQRLDTLEKRLGNEIRSRKGLTMRTAAAFGIPSKVL